MFCLPTEMEYTSTHMEEMIVSRNISKNILIYVSPAVYRGSIRLT